MAHWLDEYPVLRVMHKRIPAEDYNRIRVGLLRARLPWRLPLVSMRSLHCILDDTAWVCIDESQNNLPFLAWTGFQMAQRSGLDEAVDCELRLYHFQSGLLMGAVLDALVEAVGEHGRSQAHGHYPLTDLGQIRDPRKH